MKLRVNLNYIALALLLVAFTASAVRYGYVSATLKPSDGADAGGKTIIRFSHWQLEPGFREGLQWAIDNYNNLPHVKEANIEVIQIPLSDKIYRQFITVHLISGTAPDILYGGAKISSGTNVARFFTPLSEFTKMPNPYNAGTYLPDDLDLDLLEYLKTAPWAETFFDGMQSGFIDQLSDFFRVPISSAGGGRLFYNGYILQEVKDWLRTVYAEPHQPDWLRECWLRLENGEERGFLEPDERFEAWLRTNLPPETLGQFLTYSSAVKAFAETFNLNELVPIAASSYQPHDILLNIGRAFFFADVHELSTTPDRIQVWQALLQMAQGNWGWDAPQFREFFEFASVVSDFYPRGYQGLDRDQSQRRFVLGRAAMISAAGWDASSILYGAANRDREEDRFNVLMTPLPLPADGERWERELPYHFSEASGGGAAGAHINDASPNKEAALDFLRFITSYAINSEMNKRTGWIPVVVGAHPREELEVFMPIVEGIPEALAVSFTGQDVKVGLRNQWIINSGLVISGDITFEEFVKRMEAFVANPSVGLDKYIRMEWETANDQTANFEQSLALERVRALFGEEATTNVPREASLYYRVLLDGEGIAVLREWNRLFPGKPIPAF